MRIQHNRLAKNAYRNYSRNTGALGKNLEKLSSGYRINRAADDAAGLAISEKMRAQIMGLEAAQGNVKDGISLVKTAEGALGEIHDMLDRMVYLSTQSANGTYDDETDREQLQKEIEQLKAEINRIADSSNFNDINLLDGSLDPNSIRGVIYGSLSDAELEELFLYDDWTGSTPEDVEDGKNVLETEAVAASRAGFQISLDNVSIDLAEDDTFTLIIGDPESCDFVTLTLESGEGRHYSNAELARALAEKYANSPIQLEDSDGKIHNFNLTVSNGGKVLQFTVEDSDTDDFSLRNYGAVSYQVGDPVDSGEPKAKLTIALPQPIQDERVSDGGRGQIINGDELVFTFSGSAGYKVTLYADRNSDGTVTWKNKGGTDTVLPPGYSFIEFSGGKVIIQADEEGRQEENPFRGLKVTVSQGAAVGGWTYPAKTAPTSWDRGSGDSAVGSSYTDGDPAMTADTSAQPDPGDYAQFTMKISKGFRLSLLRAATYVFENETGVKLWFEFNQTKGAFELIPSKSSIPRGFEDARIELNHIGSNGGYDDFELLVRAKDVGYVEGNPFEGLRFYIPDNSVIVGSDGQSIEGGSGMYSPGPGVFYNGSDPGPGPGPGEDPPGADAPAASISKVVLRSGIQNKTNNVTGAPAQLANTVVDFGGVGAWTDGAKIFIDPETYTVAVGENSKFKNVKNVIDLTDAAYAAASGEDKVKFAAERLKAAAEDNRNFIVGHDGAGNTTLQQRGEVKETTDMSTKERLLSYLGVSIADPDSIENAKPGQPLTLQIGDTSDSYNRLMVSIGDTHTEALGIDNISIADQASAAAAVDKVTAVINTVSKIRGGLGAAQNRLEHTLDNLSVMSEEIQDAESTIRDTDVAEEMMSYTKNNILIQSAQAMLAQANQLPQGVLQLLS